MVEIAWTSFLQVEPQKEYLALLTYLPRKNYWKIFNFFRQTNIIRDQLKGSRGLVGYSMRAQLFGKKAWTLSVWEDESALDRFVATIPHANVMKNMSSQLTNQRQFVRWKVPGSSVPPTWESALKNLQS